MPFAHAAYAMGRIAARNALCGRWVLPAGFGTSAIPWAVFTDPEIAQVGLTEQQAAAAHPGARVAYLPMSEADRAVTAGHTTGFIKIIAGRRPVLGEAGGGQVLGATIAAARAGEMIGELALAMRTRMFTGRLAQTVHAYPTWSLAIQQARAHRPRPPRALGRHRRAHPAGPLPRPLSGHPQASLPTTQHDPRDLLTAAGFGIAVWNDITTQTAGFLRTVPADPAGTRVP